MKQLRKTRLLARTCTDLFVSQFSRKSLIDTKIDIRFKSMKIGDLPGEGISVYPGDE